MDPCLSDNRNWHWGTNQHGKEFLLENRKKWQGILTSWKSWQRSGWPISKGKKEKVRKGHQLEQPQWHMLAKFRLARDSFTRWHGGLESAWSLSYSWFSSPRRFIVYWGVIHFSQDGKMTFLAWESDLIMVCQAQPFLETQGWRGYDNIWRLLGILKEGLELNAVKLVMGCPCKSRKLV